MNRLTKPRWLFELIELRRYDILLLMAAVIFPLYKTGVTAALIVPLLAICSLYQYFITESPKSPGEFKTRIWHFTITVGFYLLTLLSFIYTSDIEDGVRTLRYNVYLLLFPLFIILLGGNITDNYFKKICFSFVIGCAAFMVYVHCQFYGHGLYANFRPAEFNDLPFRKVLMNLPYAKTHPTYMSMWFLFSSLFLIHYTIKNRVGTYFTLLATILVCLFVASSVLVSSKIAVLAFFCSLAVLIFQAIKNKLVAIVAFFILVVVFATALFNISFLRARFIDEFRATKFKPPVGLNTNSLNVRVGIFECSKTVFINNWLFGTGIGDAQNELNKCYDNFDTNFYREGKYNTHNNYFDIAITTGVLGLAAFLFMWTFHIVQAVRNGNSLFLVFLVFVLVCMLGENILSRYNGVVFYAIFNSLFVRLNLQGKTV
ncbi:MAG: O-antigen ligase family protein [Chryseolinea sp.]